ncbi:hypothetical protein VTJ49DRAFT_1331 [Mycothermus thermophilus]|uniref:Uncharacterized protein n=1 Tax=Humicola insolens TaxID=85995 RepID=A0ABR3VCL6_HUMIN
MGFLLSRPSRNADTDIDDAESGRSTLFLSPSLLTPTDTPLGYGDNYSGPTQHHVIYYDRETLDRALERAQRTRPVRKGSQPVAIPSWEPRLKHCSGGESAGDGHSNIAALVMVDAPEEFVLCAAPAAAYPAGDDDEGQVRVAIVPGIWVFQRGHSIDNHGIIIVFVIIIQVELGIEIPVRTLDVPPQLVLLAPSGAAYASAQQE